MFFPIARIVGILIAAITVVACVAHNISQAT